MIIYKNEHVWHRLVVWRMKGSVFPKALCSAVPCAVLSAIVHEFTKIGQISWTEEDEAILRETQGWAGFSFLVGFLIVFRTSQAYNRFWEGCTSTHNMRAEWFDACSALTAFCAHSQEPKAKVLEFKHVLIRLFSMLHAAALGDLQDINQDNPAELQSYDFELLDPMGIDDKTLEATKLSHSRVELLFEWIQLLIVENINTGVLSIPPPILSRAFQEIANGMVAFHDSAKLSYIPFPFPYAQTCDFLILLHWSIMPLVIAQWVTKWYWATVFTFCQAFVVWSLHFIAVEIENPFGSDPNDLDGAYMQQEFNRHLVLLLHPRTSRTPMLAKPRACFSEDPNVELVFGDKNMSFNGAWHLAEGNLDSIQPARSNRHSISSIGDNALRKTGGVTPPAKALRRAHTTDLRTRVSALMKGPFAVRASAPDRLSWDMSSQNDRTSGTQSMPSDIFSRRDDRGCRSSCMSAIVPLAEEAPGQPGLRKDSHSTPMLGRASLPNLGSSSWTTSSLRLDDSVVTPPATGESAAKEDGATEGDGSASSTNAAEPSSLTRRKKTVQVNSDPELRSPAESQSPVAFAAVLPQASGADNAAPWPASASATAAEAEELDPSTASPASGQADASDSSGGRPLHLRMQPCSATPQEQVRAAEARQDSKASCWSASSPSCGEAARTRAGRRWSRPRPPNPSQYAQVCCGDAEPEITGPEQGAGLSTPQELEDNREDDNSASQHGSVPAGHLT